MENNGRRAYEVVVAYVEARILSGDLEVGDLLPAERDLAVQLGVSRSAVREGVRTLQAQGVLRSSVGAGNAGGTRVSAVPAGALTRLLRLHVALANFPLEDVVEVRVALERLSSRLAAHDLDQGIEDRMRRALAGMRESLTSREAFNDHDTDFHVAIAEAAGNRLAEDTTVAIRESMRLPLLRGFARLDDDGFAQVAGDLLREHEEIFQALVAGDGARAEDLMEQHVRTAWERVGGNVGRDEVPQPGPGTMQA